MVRGHSELSPRRTRREIGPSTSNYTQTPFTMITRMYYVQLDMHTVHLAMEPNMRSLLVR